MLAEFEALEGTITDEVRQDQREWVELVETLIAEAVAVGDLRHDIDIQQLSFELTAPIQLANYYFVLVRDPATLKRARAAVSITLARARSVAESDLQPPLK